MRRLLAALGLALAILIPASASAEDLWSLKGFRADIAVSPDGGIDVVETIDAEFLVPRHGIYRYVPYRGKDDAGRSYRVDVRLESVTRDGEQEPVSTSRSGQDVVWKIGDADRTMTGEHRYVLTYRVDGAIKAFDGFDELYWNVTGDGWDVPLPASKAFVTLPGAVTEADLKTACYTGAYGSTAHDCTIAFGGEAVAFGSTRAGDPMTIAVGFPKGLVSGPPLWRVIAGWLARWGVWFLPLFVFALMYRTWKRHGDDPDLGAIVAQYDPPEGLAPAETRALIAQRAGTEDLAPTIVDLASRGYLRIEEVGEKKLMFSTFDHELVLTGTGDDAALRPYERRLLADLFENANGRVAVSSLKNKFYTKVKPFMTGVKDSLVARGYFAEDPEKVRATWIGIGVGTIILAWLLVPLASAFLATSAIAPVVLSGVIVIVFGVFMPKWSDSGAAAAAHAKGFKEFISKVEKYRAPWMEDQNVFFRVLPYALAFGLGKKWAQAFAGLQMQPPSWYVGAQAGAWNAVSFGDSISSWASGFTSTATSTPSSSSGSGGGGFSGGGGGGGGGGSW